MEEKQILDAMRQVIDPEVGVNIVDLGLIYGVEFSGPDKVKVTMTMTTMGCPLHAFLQDEAKKYIKKSFPDIKEVETLLVWEPAWSSDMMSEAAKSQLGW